MRNTVKQAGDAIVKTVLEQLASDDDWRRYRDSLDYKPGDTYAYEVRADGSVHVLALGTLPLDWTQRRSIARAYRKAHARMTEALVAAGQRAKAAGDREVGR